MVERAPYKGLIYVQFIVLRPFGDIVQKQNAWLLTKERRSVTFCPRHLICGISSIGKARRMLRARVPYVIKKIERKNYDL